MISFDLSPWLLAPCVLVASGFAYLAYRRASSELARTQRIILTGLRFAALFSILLLLLRPTWRQTRTEVIPPVLGVLVDNSQSMQLEPEDGAGSAAQETVQALASLPDHPGTTRLFAFDALGREFSAAESLKFAGDATDISRALADMRRALQDGHLRAALLITDGRYNIGRNPVHAASEFGVPIHTLVVGDTLERRDLQIRRILTNDVGYVDRDQPVQVLVRSQGLPAQNVEVRLMHADTLVGSAALRLQEGSSSGSAEFVFRPAAAGLQQLSATVTQQQGEITYRNNAAAVAVRVLESRPRVLLLAAGPGPDLSAVRLFLEEGDRAEVDTYVQKEPGLFYEGAFSAPAAGYDLIVLAGFPGPSAPPLALDYVRTAAESGTPLFFLASQQTDLTLLGTTLGPSLPAFPVGPSPVQGEAMFVATAAGLQHPAMDFADAGAFSRLPPLTRNPVQWELSADARVLAVTRREQAAAEEPFLVIRNRAGSRTAALLGARTWRWTNLPRDLEAYNDYWSALFDALTQWLTAPDDRRLVRIDPAEATFPGGVPVQLLGQAYDESLNPQDDAIIDVEITAPDGSRLPYRMEPVGNGRFALDLGALPEGTYGYEAEATRQDLPLGRDTGIFTVGALQLEYRETHADAALLRQLATRSGGTFLRPASLESLPEVLGADSSFVPELRTTARERNLWHWFPVFWLVVSLLAAEWILRKRAGLV